MCKLSASQSNVNMSLRYRKAVVRLLSPMHAALRARFGRSFGQRQTRDVGGGRSRPPCLPQISRNGRSRPVDVSDVYSNLILDLL